MKKKILVSVFVFLLSLSGVYALSVPESQETVSLTIEQGSEETFHLVVKELDMLTTLTSSGDISSWITFGENNEESYLIYILKNQSIEVDIFVPNDAEVGTYTGEIKGNGQILSELTVIVTKPMHETLSDLYEEIGNIKNETNLTQDEIDSLREEILQKIDELYQYQKDLGDFESEKTDLLGRISELENETADLKKQNQEINSVTGNVALNWSSISLSLGILIGVVASFVYVKRDKIKVRKPGIRIKKEKSFYQPRYG